MTTIKRTPEQQEYRNKLALTLKNLRELGHKQLAEVLLSEEKKRKCYREADNRKNREQREKFTYTLEHQIENFLSSPEFINFTKTLDFQWREKVIENVIQYSIAFQNEEGTMDYSRCMKYIEACQKKANDRGDKLEELIAENLWITRKDADYEQRMKEYYYEKFFKNGYVFHAFNSQVESSIKKHGLSNSIRFTFHEEISKIKTILKRYGESDVFAWWEKGNDDKRICYDYTAANIRSYANFSPEWFWLFVGRFHSKYCGWYSYKPDKNIKPTYEMILQGMNIFFKDKNVSQEDQNTMKETFQKWRNLYGDTQPRLAMIKMSAVYDCTSDDPKIRKGNDTFNLEYYKKKIFKWNDCSTDKSISPENIKIVSFPQDITPQPLGIDGIK